MEQIKNAVLKVEISPTFEAHFRYLMSKVPDTEWGGVVVYDLENSFFDEEIKVTILDFLLLDIGSVAETKHTYGRNPELTSMFLKYVGKPYGLIHSHTNSVFYSKTDDEEIIANEKYYPKGYLSVVVNSEGDLLARLSKYFITTISKTFTYNGESKTVESTYKDLHYVQTEININQPTAMVDERIALIKKRKEKAKKKSNYTTVHTPGFYSKNKNKNKKKNKKSDIAGVPPYYTDEELEEIADSVFGSETISPINY